MRHGNRLMRGPVILGVMDVKHADRDNLRTLTAMIDTPVQRAESAGIVIRVIITNFSKRYAEMITRISLARIAHVLERYSRSVMIAGRSRRARSAVLIGF